MADASVTSSASVASPTNAAIAIVAPTARSTNTTNSPGIVKNNQSQVKLQNNVIHVAAPRHFLHQPMHQIGTGNGQWPLVEPVFHFGPGFEHQNYCPTHSQGPHPHEHVVFFHINPGVSVSFQIAGNREIIRGPITMPMVAQGVNPPIAMPAQVPPGHVMQQIIDENGTLLHVILSTAQYQQLHGPSGVHNIQSHLPGHYISANNTAPLYFNPISTNLQSTASGPYFHSIPHHTQQQPQPVSQSVHAALPSTSNYYKDERTQRQHSKLLKKLDQKQKDTNSTLPAQSLSSLKCDINGFHRVVKNGTSLDTLENIDKSAGVTDEEDECQLIVEQLSSVQSPKISEITPRSALLQWLAPMGSENVVLNTKDLSYEVLLSDRGKEGKYKIIFKGASLSCRIRDLRPGQEYSICLQVYLGERQGSASEAAIFTTPSCEPDQPLAPKLIARTKNSLQLRWNASADNGAHIQHYILEYDEGKGNEFVEVIKMKGKQYSLSKLQPSTWYSFRLCAVNDCGKSAYSEVITYSTSGNPPLQLSPPILVNSTSSSLRLSWNFRTQDEEFVLQIADFETGHGFLNAYTGKDTIYECTKLKRASSFQFRLRAENEAGASIWSDPVIFRTQPERPGRPQKPHVKGKILSTHFKVKWEPPNDKGGAEISFYHFEINAGSGFEQIYTGSDTETICDHLQPGTIYQFRVACEGPGGVSVYSELGSVTTEAIAPGIPCKPYCGSSPGPYAAIIRWEHPEYNGGAPVSEYELEIQNEKLELKKVIYKGNDLYSIAKDLLPGEQYSAQVRALNRIGYSLWSPPLTFNTSSAPPFAPEMPNTIIRSSAHITVNWNEPSTNGASISEYRLYMSINDPDGYYNNCYQGTADLAELRNLTPFTKYYFKVNASNVAGTSSFSSVAFAQTHAAAPGITTISSYRTTYNSVTLLWKEPENNGSPILYYNIDCSDKIFTTKDNSLEYTIEELLPETIYKVKIQSVNEIGVGIFSNSFRITTNPLPPTPPKLECVAVGHNFLKLKWGDGKNIDYTRFYVEMYNNRCKEYQNIYVGTLCTCKVNKLQEQTSYAFRICSETDHGGLGNYSPAFNFQTNCTLPNNIKSFRIVENENQLILEWNHSRNIFTDLVEYMLQCSTSTEQEFKQIYRGKDTHYAIDKVDNVGKYIFRVCPIRITQNKEICGTFSTVLRYTVPSTTDGTCIEEPTHLHNMETSTSKSTVSKFIGKLSPIYPSKKKFTDQEKAIMFAIFFMVLTIAFASIVKMFIS